MVGKTPKPGSSLERSDAIFRERGIPINENPATETTVLFLGPQGAAALAKTKTAETIPPGDAE